MYDIYPTHTCFDDTVEIMMNHLKENPQDFRRLRIIHAICLMPSGRRYAHAWVEIGDEAMFMGIVKKKRAILVVDKKEYHEKMEVQEFVAYTIPEAIVNEKKYGKAPYKPEYLALCNDKGKLKQK